MSSFLVAVQKKRKKRGSIYSLSRRLKYVTNVPEERKLQNEAIFSSLMRYEFQNEPLILKKGHQKKCPLFLTLSKGNNNSLYKENKETFSLWRGTCHSYFSPLTSSTRYFEEKANLISQIVNYEQSPYFLCKRRCAKLFSQKDSAWKPVRVPMWYVHKKNECCPYRSRLARMFLSVPLPGEVVHPGLLRSRQFCKACMRFETCYAFFVLRRVNLNAKGEPYPYPVDQDETVCFEWKFYSH